LHDLALIEEGFYRYSNILKRFHFKSQCFNRWEFDLGQNWI